MPPKRTKHTSSPLWVCVGCWWEGKYKRLVELHKRLRLEFLRIANKRRAHGIDMTDTEVQGDDEDS